MKRQRGVNVNGNGVSVRPVNNNNNMNPPNVEDVAAILGKKKVKKEGEQKVVKEEEDRKESRDMLVGESSQHQHQHQGARDGAIMGWNWEDNNQNMLWLGVGGVVDEQMSWGSTWLPGWDMDLLGGEAFTALYNDVVWDDDIWNLNNQIPIPLDRKEV